MDQKTWLWKKKSSDQKVVVVGAAVENVKGHEEEIQTLLSDKAELENKLRILTDKLSSALLECNAKDDLIKKQVKIAQEAVVSSALLECNAKDDLIKKQVKIAQEAVAGRDTLETKLVSLKHELDEALKQIATAQERSTHLDAALKECMQQLRFVREEQERRIHDAIVKTSREYEKSLMLLEENLADTDKRLAKIGVENTHLTKVLLSKEKLIDDLSKQKAQVEVEFSALMTRLESMERDNASLKYEVRVIEKELEIRNEESEFNRRTSDVSHRQHLESVKKIAKLESECQRLRVLVRKRLPGPAALAKMKNEVEILGRDCTEMRRRRSNVSLSGFMEESATDNGPDTPSKKISSLIEKLRGMEEENMTLKEALSKKANELQFSRTMYARTASQLSQVESNFDELSKGQTTLETPRSVRMSHDFSHASMSDVGSDDKVSCSESWASALISELDHFKHKRQSGPPSSKTVGDSDMNLMDDFVEMERLAIVSVDDHSGSPHVSSDENNAFVTPIKTVLNGESGSWVSNQEIKSKDKTSDWLQDILRVVLEQSNVTQRKPDEMLEDVRVALGNINDANVLHNDGHGPSKPKEMPSTKESSDGITDKNNLELQSDLSKSVGKIIELIEGITQPHHDYTTSETMLKNEGTISPYKSAESPSGYMVRVLQWKTSELSAVLHQFVHSCYDMLSGKSNVNRFAQELCFALDWTINHCFSLQDVSSMRYEAKKHFDWDETRSESEVEVPAFRVDKSLLSNEQLSCLPTVSATNGHHSYVEKDGFQPPDRDESKNFKAQSICIESVEKQSDGKIESATNSDSFMSRLHESEKTIASLQTELDALKSLKEMLENQIENHKLMKEDLDTQLTVAKAELIEARHKFSSMEVELENKTSCCEELEATCLDLQLQLDSLQKKAIFENEFHQEEKQLRTDWEITAASEKLAECQETILTLGKQLKALASSSEGAMFDKVVSTPTHTNANSVLITETAALPVNQSKITNQRSSLLDQMLAEDNNLVKGTKSNNKQSENYRASAFVSSGAIEPLEKILLLNGSRRMDNDLTANSLAIVRGKKRASGSLWKKLLWKRKKSGRKLPVPFAP